MTSVLCCCLAVAVAMTSGQETAPGQGEIKGCTYRLEPEFNPGGDFKGLMSWIRGRNVKRLQCSNFSDDYVPFVEAYRDVKFIELAGNFTKVSFDSRYLEVEDVSLELGGATKELSFASFRYFKNLEKITIRTRSRDVASRSVVYLGGVGVLEKVLEIDLRGNSVASIVGGSFKKSFPNLKQLYLNENALAEFSFDSVPERISLLNVAQNQITELGAMDALKNFNKLTILEARDNLLSAFDFSYLPDHKMSVSLMNNRITDAGLDGLLQTRASKVSLDFSQNPINCDCKMLDSFVSLIRQKKLECRSWKCFNCAADSKLGDHRDLFDDGRWPRPKEAKKYLRKTIAALKKLKRSECE